MTNVDIQSAISEATLGLIRPAILIRTRKKMDGCSVHTQAGFNLLTPYIPSTPEWRTYTNACLWCGPCSISHAGPSCTYTGRVQRLSRPSRPAFLQVVTHADSQNRQVSAIFRGRHDCHDRHDRKKRYRTEICLIPGSVWPKHP